MQREKTVKKDLYYTKDHEWIDFQGSVAYTGVCHFKLIGFKKIHKITYKGKPGLKKQGDVIATIKYKDYTIEVHMPVDGKLVSMNEALLSDNLDILLQQAENHAWIAMIVPSQPYERKGLLLPEQYQMNGKSKYAKE